MAQTQKKQHDSTPLHVRWSFPWWFRALLHGGPPLFISSFLLFLLPFYFYFCNMKPTANRHRENGTSGGRRSFGRVVSSSDTSRILPSCGSNRTFFFKHHRSQGRFGYCAAFSNLGDWGKYVIVRCS